MHMLLFIPFRNGHLICIALHSVSLEFLCVFISIIQVAFGVDLGIIENEDSFFNKAVNQVMDGITMAGIPTFKVCIFFSTVFLKVMKVCFKKKANKLNTKTL